MARQTRPVRFLKMHDGLWQGWRKGILYELELLDRHDADDGKRRWLIRVNKEVVDAANTLATAKELACACALNNDL